MAHPSLAEPLHYRVLHQTTLTYGLGVPSARLNVRLLPVAWPGQELLASDLQIAPDPVERRDTQGPYRVNVTTATFRGTVRQVSVTSRLHVAVAPPPLPGPTPSIANLRDAALASRDLGPAAPAAYLYASRLAGDVPAIADWAAPMLDPARRVLDAAQALSARIHDEFAYDPGATDTRTLPDEAFAKRSGVCQDFAHIMIVALRGSGIPAAYVSGYLRTRPPPGMARLIGADAMHAWPAVWCGPDVGWVGIDPTNDCLARENHIVVAMGRDYADVAPIDGVFTGSGAQTMTYSVDVAEDPGDLTMR